MALGRHPVLQGCEADNQTMKAARTWQVTHCLKLRFAIPRTVPAWFELALNQLTVTIMYHRSSGKFSAADSGEGIVDEGGEDFHSLKHLPRYRATAASLVDKLAVKQGMHERPQASRCEEYVLPLKPCQAID